MNNAERLAADCAAETGADLASDRAHEIALIAIAASCGDRQEWKAAIKQEYQRRHPECGSVFLVIILPIIVNLIVRWLERRIWPDNREALKADAIARLG